MWNVAERIWRTFFSFFDVPNENKMGQNCLNVKKEIASSLNVDGSIFLVMGLRMYKLYLASGKLSHHFEFLSSAGLLSLPHPLASPHLIDVKVRGKTAQLTLFPLQDLSLARPPWGRVFLCVWMEVMLGGSE